MKIANRNEWRDSTCPFSLHYEDGSGAAFWTEHDQLWFYPRGYLDAPSNEKDHLLVRKRSGGWWLKFIGDTGGDHPDYGKLTAGPFPSRRAALAAWRMLST
jgi:hypothetical protein